MLFPKNISWFGHSQISTFRPPCFSAQTDTQLYPTCFITYIIILLSFNITMLFGVNFSLFIMKRTNTCVFMEDIFLVHCGANKMTILTAILFLIFISLSILFQLIIGHSQTIYINKKCVQTLSKHTWRRQNRLVHEKYFIDIQQYLLSKKSILAQLIPKKNMDQCIV